MIFSGTIAERIAQSQRDTDARFDQMDSLLAALPAAIGSAIRTELWNTAVPVIEADAKATDSYNDDTGATRAGTVAYVATEAEERDEVVEAVEAANALRPESASVEDRPFTQHGDATSLNLMVDVWAPTNYSFWLNVRNGLESMFIADALLVNLALIEIAIASGAQTALADTFGLHALD